MVFITSSKGVISCFLSPCLTQRIQRWSSQWAGGSGLSVLIRKPGGLSLGRSQAHIAHSYPSIPPPHKDSWRSYVTSGSFMILTASRKLSKVPCRHMDALVLAFVCAATQLNCTFWRSDEPRFRMSSVSSVDVRLLGINADVFKWPPWFLGTVPLWLLWSGDVWPHRWAGGSIAGYHIKAVWPEHCKVLASQCLLWTTVYLNPLMFIFLLPSVPSWVYQLQSILSPASPLPPSLSSSLLIRPTLQ